MSWVLIFYVIHWGEAITSNSVRFNSKQACEQAIVLLNAKHGLDKFNSGRILVNAYCVEDKR